MNTRDTAYWNDQRLMEIATYYETKGLMIPVKNMDSISQRFVEYKGLVKRGEFTMEEMQEDVY